MGVGTILKDEHESDLAVPFVLPASIVRRSVGKRIVSYVKSTRPELIDYALLRPIRFGKKFYVGLPNEDERRLILEVLARDKAIASDVDLDAIARSDYYCNLSGFDLVK